MDTKDKNNSKEVSVAFWGDSLTEGFPGASYFEILRRRLPEYKLLNRGKSGDTVISLYRRLRNSPIDDPVDIAFLWVGTNDVFPKISWSYPVIKTLNNQPWAKSPGEFEKYFRLTLVILSQRAGKVITVPPLFMGEQINNRWSQEMKELSEIIERVSASDKSVEFLDLRKIIFPKLKDKSVSDYIPTSAVKVLLDVLLLKQRDEFDRKSADRGLFFTLDGVHLNSSGAEIVAESFLETIKSYERTKRD